MQNANSCLAEIELLSSDASSENRRELLRRVTDLFFLTSEQHTPNDGVVFGNVMERIAFELEIEARAELSERISEIDKAPHHLVSRLASDEIEVAKPVLERSSVLTDTDLIQIAKSRGQTHLHAISKRPTLSSPVTDVIVDRGESEVLVEVTNNKGAEFSRGGIDQLAQKARNDGNLLTALGKRTDLPTDVMEDVKRRVAEKIKTEMAERQIDADMADIDSLVDQGAANLDLDAFKSSDANLRARAQSNELGEEEVVGHAAAGRISDVVHTLSVLSGLDPRMVSHCLLKADIAALGILCKANDFEGTTFLALIKMRNGDQRIRSADIARSMREYENLSVGNANRTLRFLKVRCKTAAESEEMPQLGSKSLWTAHHNLKDQPRQA